MYSDRLLKNTHQSRASLDFPHPSPCQAQGRLVAAYVVGDAYMRPLQGISGALHLGIFEQPGKDDFFSSLLKDGLRFKD